MMDARDPSIASGVVQLHVGERESVIQVHLVSAQALEYRLSIGTSSLGARGVGDEPLRESDLETAIEVVEDAVMPLVRLFPAGATLASADPEAQRLVALGTGAHGAAAISLGAVEGLFGQLTLAAQRGSWSGTVRLDQDMAAYVLILRELMHHGGFDQLVLNG